MTGADAGRELDLDVGGGVHLWARVVGEGPDVLLVPTCGNAADLALLCRPGRRVVFYDVRNRGRSSAVTDRRLLGFGAEVDDVARVRDALGLDRCSVLGWSYHGGVVARHALAHPGTVDRVVLAAPVAPRAGTATRAGAEPNPAELAHLDQLRAAGLEHSDPARWCREWRSVYVPKLLGRPEAFDRMVDVCALANEHPQHVAEAMVHVFAELVAYDWRPALAALDAPLLVIHGSEDPEPLDTAYEWASSVPSGCVEEVEGVGQLPWVEEPDRVAALVDAFVSSPP